MHEILQKLLSAHSLSIAVILNADRQTFPGVCNNNSQRQAAHLPGVVSLATAAHGTKPGQVLRMRPVVMAMIDLSMQLSTP